MNSEKQRKPIKERIREGENDRVKERPKEGETDR